VKIAFHEHFNKGTNDLLAPLISPNVQHFQHVQHGEPHPINTAKLTPTSLTFTNTPYLDKTDKKSVPITCTAPLSMY
jgi:hypothetical protein